MSKINTLEQNDNQDAADQLASAIRSAFDRSAANDYSGAAIYATYLASKYNKDSFDAQDLTRILGIGVNAAYELLHTETFPSINVGQKYVVSAYELALWLQFRRKELWVK